MSQWLEVANIDDIPIRGTRVVVFGNLNVALFRTSDNQVYALEDSCPHRGGPLSQGMVHDNSVTCPQHNWRIDLESGEALGPDQGCTGRFPVKVELGRIYVSLQRQEAVA